MSSCVFCKIIKGELPCYKVFEDKHTLVFMDIANDVNGHMLAVPKKHCTNILDCDEATLKHLIKTVQKVSNHLTENCGYSGINLLNASGKCAGQSVGHFHIHIIPRKNDDGIDAWPAFNGGNADIKDIWNKVRL